MFATLFNLMHCVLLIMCENNEGIIFNLQYFSFNQQPNNKRRYCPFETFDTIYSQDVWMDLVLFNAGEFLEASIYIYIYIYIYELMIK